REKRTAAAEAARLLNTLSPLNVLDRGYSVTFAPDGSAVQSSTALCAGDAVRLRFAKGSAGATVTSVEEAQTVSR
ncbi:MAG: exodeoxyribonuclease VII large subunit, partial [Myxococcota bacterium]